MDTEKLEKALEFANYRITLNTQIEQLKATMRNRLVLAKNGGFFTCSPSFVSFVNTLVEQGTESSALLDDNETPIRIEKLKEFRDEMLTRYQETVNSYFREYEKLRRARKVRSIVELDDDAS
jgi:uncharacterized protein YqkB